jgi:protein-tyrosine kinase
LKFEENIVTSLRAAAEDVAGSAESTAQLRLARSPTSPATLPRLVVVDRAALRAAGLVPEESAERRLADQYRRIKRPILEKVQALRTAHAPGAQLLMVAGALPGDGKTFTSINLALSIARERDFTVLLVDADVAKNHMTRMFDVAAEPGLLDALHDGSIDVESLVLPTDVPGLSILPAGRAHEAATELLASAGMATLAARLTERDPTRVVLFDSGPLLLSSEARAVANLVAQIVLVVHAGVTPQNAVREAIAHIPADKLTGLVLNQSKATALDDGYGYGYGYGYGIPQNKVSSNTPAASAAKGGATRLGPRIQPVIR